MKSLLKAAVAAFSLVTTFAVGAAEILSVNLGSNEQAVPANGAFGYVPTPASSWINVTSQRSNDEQTGQVEGLTVYDNDTGTTTEYPAARIDWTADGTWNWEASAAWTTAHPEMKGYFDDHYHRIVVTVSGLPFKTYDILVYYNSDNGGKKFAPVSFTGQNGTYYTWDANAGEARVATGAGDSWGTTHQNAYELGVNIIRVNGLEFENGVVQIATAARDGDNTRGSVAAIQIIGVVEDTMPEFETPPSFYYETGSGNRLQAGPHWYPTGNEQYASSWMVNGFARQERIAYGHNAYVIKDGDAAYCPEQGVEFKSLNKYTVSFLVDITGMEVPEGKRGVIASIGTPADWALVLYKDSAGNVSLIPSRNNEDRIAGLMTIPAESIAPGYHLFTVTSDMNANNYKGEITLRMDGGEIARSAEYQISPNSSLNVGRAWTGTAPDPYVAGEGMAVYAVLGWDDILTNDQLSNEQDTGIFDLYRPVLDTPLVYNYTSNFNNGYDDGVLYIPSMAGDYAIQGSRGTVEIMSNAVVTVPSVALGIIGNRDLAFDVYGTLNVTSASTKAEYHVHNEAGDKKGIIFGWNGTGNGAENVYGEINATNCWLEVNYRHAREVLTVDGGRMTVYGVYAPNMNGGSSNASLVLKNGGVFEAAVFYLPGTWPLSLGDGTIRALRYDEESNGLVHTSPVEFTDGAVGTTLDPNGLAISFTGAATGDGRIVIEDSSEARDGVVTLSEATGFNGQIDVKTGTLNLDMSRPTGTVYFEEGTKLVLVESIQENLDSVESGLGVAKVYFYGEPEVTMYRADRRTPVEYTIETDEDGRHYIAYVPSDLPVVSGEACWCDWEFNDYSVTSVGRAKIVLVHDHEGIHHYMPNGTDDDDFRDAGTIYASAMPWYTGNDIAYPANWSAAFFATVPERKNLALICFGKMNQNEDNPDEGGIIALVSGDVSKNEVLLIRTEGFNGPRIVLASMTVPNAYTAPHLYAFTKKPNSIDIYLDGVLWTTYNSATAIDFGIGLQLGSIVGGWGNHGAEKFIANNDPNSEFYWNGPLVQNAYIDMIRLFDSPLTEKQLEALTYEFPYFSPNGNFRRTVAADSSWKGRDVWTRVGADGAADTPADEPAPDSVAIVTAAGNSSLTVGTDEEPEEVVLESLEVRGDAQFTLAAAEGSSLVNRGRTIVSTPTVFKHGIDISGGPLAIVGDGSLTFDWSDWDMPIGIDNATVPLTGVCDPDAPVTFIEPNDTKGRTFTVDFDPTLQKWSVTYSRGPLEIEWAKPGEVVWDDRTVWYIKGTETEVGCISGDIVHFRDVPGCDKVTIDASVTKNLAALTFSAATTAYEISGGSVTAPGVSDTATAPVVYAGTLNVDNGPLAVSGDISNPHRYLDVRGTLSSAEFLPGTDESARSSLTLGTGAGGTLNVASITVGHHSDLEIAGEGGTINAAGVVSVDATAKVTKTGTSTFSYTAADNAFYGSLEVSDGTFTVNAAFTQALATEESPIRVNGTGTLYCVAAANAYNRLPDSARVVVEGAGATFLVQGENPFKRDSSLSPTVVCRDGGTFQSNGAANNNDVHLWDLVLDSGRLYLSGNVAMWNSRGIRIDGSLRSTGDSVIERAADSPNRLDVNALDVADGTLTLRVPTSAALVKTGAGALVLEGDGGSWADFVEIRAGTLVASAQLVNPTPNVEGNVKTVQLQNGTAFDVSRETGTFDFAAFQEEGGKLETNGRITLVTGDRVIRNGDRLISWATAPLGTFMPASAESPVGFVKKADGLYAVVGMSITIR